MSKMVRQVVLAAFAIVLVLGWPVSAQDSPNPDTRANAEAGDADAQVQLGFYYATGLRTTQKDAEAVAWYRKAAEQGHPMAQFWLGSMYRQGRGVAQDNVSAHMWFNLSASRSASLARDTAVSARDDIADGMTPEEIAEAQRLAREWDAAHPR